MVSITKIFSQYLDCQFLLSLNILSSWTHHVMNFPNINGIVSPPNLHLRFSIVVLETSKLERQCSQYLELNPTCENDITNGVPIYGYLYFAISQQNKNANIANFALYQYKIDVPLKFKITKR